MCVCIWKDTHSPDLTEAAGKQVRQSVTSQSGSLSGPDMLCKYRRQVPGFSSPKQKAAPVDHINTNTGDNNSSHAVTHGTHTRHDCGTLEQHLNQ